MLPYPLLQVLFEVFRELDADGGGAIGFDELFEFVHMRCAPNPTL